MSKNIINLATGQLVIATNDATITTHGIGSCVVIMLYDPVTKIGAMAHSMLPTNKNTSTSIIFDPQDIVLAQPIPLGKYADEAIDHMVNSIEKFGGSKDRLIAKLVGGARMFKVLSGDEHGIGFQNVESAKNKLLQLGIFLEKEDTGGTVGKNVEYDLVNGLVDISTKM